MVAGNGATTVLKSMDEDAGGSPHDRVALNTRLAGADGLVWQLELGACIFAGLLLLLAAFELEAALCASIFATLSDAISITSNTLVTC